jgi:starvation-inducible DNA-binding protein
MSSSIQQALNKQIANWSLLYVKLHNYHWYVKGNQFFTLHLKFEELYNEAALHIDELAERVLALGGHPVATMKAHLEHSSLKEANGTESAAQMVETIIEDFSIVIEEFKQAMAISQEANDETTSDMLLAMQTLLEKHRWMLRSFLG